MKRKGLFAAMFSMALAFGILIGACSMGGDSSSSGPGPVTDNPSTGVMSEATGRAIFAISPASGGVSIDRFIDAAALEAYLTLPARASVGGGSVLKINKIGLWNVVAIGDGAFDPSKGAASLAAAGVTTISLPVTITVIVPNAFTGAESAAGSGVKITLEIPSSVIDDVINNLSQDDKDELEGAITVAPVEVIPDGLNVDTALARGKDALKAGNYDAAVGYYQAAYQAGPNNPEAITYSVLAELAAISVDPDVQILVRDRLGVVNYPGTMGVLFTTDWMTEYIDDEPVYEYYDENDGWILWSYSYNGPGYYKISDWSFVSSERKYERYTDSIGPALALPDWFKNTSTYTHSLENASGLGAVQSSSTLFYLLAANLLDKNTEGLNPLFNEILSSVFGSKFEEIAGRVNRLGTAEVTLDAEVVAALGLDELLEGDDLIIGKPELDTLVAGIRILKATFELLASYDWNADFSFAKFDWADHGTFAAKMAGVNVNQLPFRNSFLNSQDQTMLNKAKQDYLAALSAISSVYDTIGDRDHVPQAVRDELDNYRWIQDGINKLHAAINTGGTFWIPEDLPSGQTWPVLTQADAQFGIDMGKLFTLNYLKLNDIVEVSGQNPVFYGFNETTDTWTKINSLADIDSYEVLGFNFKTAKLKGLVPKGFADSDDEVIAPVFPAEIGKEFYRKYYP